MYPKEGSFVKLDGTRGNYTGSCDSCVVIWNGKPGFTRITSMVQDA